MISSFHRYKYPCLFSEKLIFEMADRMAEDGFKDAGYEFVSIDVSTYHVTYYKAKTCSRKYLYPPTGKS